jgi:hypothetical protein
MSVFLMWLICSYHLHFFQWKLFYYVTPSNVIGVHFQTFKIKTKNLKLNQMNFYSKFLDIYMKEKELIFHDYYGLK